MKGRPALNSSTGITCVSRWARPSKIAASTASSFASYERGNALKKSEIRYRPEFFETNARLQTSVCTGNSLLPVTVLAHRTAGPYRRPPGGSGLLLQQLQAAVRFRAAIHL